MSSILDGFKDDLTEGSIFKFTVFCMNGFVEEEISRRSLKGSTPCAF
jgi:hypothetical protein